MVPGFPDDGRDYGEITPGTDTNGKRVVVWFRAQHIHGRAISDPTPGAHIDPAWTLKRQAQYWIALVADEDLEEYIRVTSLGGRPRPEIVAYAPITRAWRVPGVPAPRSPGPGGA